jgi:hypothetical protein
LLKQITVFLFPTEFLFLIIPAEIELYFCPAEIAEIAERGYAPCHADSKQVIQKD